MRILVVEDEAALGAFLQESLAPEGGEVEVVSDGRQAVERALGAGYDLLLLDLNLPEVSGLEVLRKVREQKPALPVLVLTARSEIEDRVRGLDSGADDYLTKPFSMLELKARVRALLRRRGGAAADVLRVGELELRRSERVVRRAGRRIDLTPREFALLEYLMLHAGERLARAEIFEQVWRQRNYRLTNIVDVYINYLRRKVDDGFATPLIHTERGVGYRISAEPAGPRA
jgi:DNA-binding response OmpR family regulator